MSGLQSRRHQQNDPSGWCLTKTTYIFFKKRFPGSRERPYGELVRLWSLGEQCAARLHSSYEHRRRVFKPPRWVVHNRDMWGESREEGDYCPGSLQQRTGTKEESGIRYCRSSISVGSSRVFIEAVGRGIDASIESGLGRTSDESGDIPA